LLPLTTVFAIFHTINKRESRVHLLLMSCVYFLYYFLFALRLSIARAQLDKQAKPKHGPITTGIIPKSIQFIIEQTIKINC
jgi:hypothetical protein